MQRRSTRNKPRPSNESASKSNGIETNDKPVDAPTLPRTRTRAAVAKATETNAKSKSNLSTSSSKKAAISKTTNNEEEQATDGLFVSEPSNGAETEQINTGSDRLLAIERLMAALRESDLGTDLDSIKPKNLKRRTGRIADSSSSSNGSSGDEDDRVFEQTSEGEEKEEEEEEEGGDEQMLGDEPETTDNADRELEKKEKKLILRFKMAESRDKGVDDKQVDAKDIDWSDFDIETINEILARREQLNRVNKLTPGENMQESTTSKLKKSSLAPAPMNLRKVRSVAARRPRDDIEEGEEVEDQDMVEYEQQDDEEVHMDGQQQEQQQVPEEEEEDEEEGKQNFYGEGEGEPEDGLDRMDIDGEEIGDIEVGRRIVELFEDIDEGDVLVQGQMSLHLPPRALMQTDELNTTDQSPDIGRQQQQQQQLELRPHPAMVRGNGFMDAVPSGPPKDMRLELQYELRREDRLLKDLKAEIMDKLFKLQAEEKLLRMIVKHDFDIPQDDAADDLAGNAAAAAVGMDTPAYGAFSEVGNAEQQSDYIAAAAAAAAAVAAATQSSMLQNDDAMESDSDASSLSGMSSSSSEDEVQDEEITRGALSRVLKQYLPDEE